MTLVLNDILRLTVGSLYGGSGQGVNVFYAKLASIGTGTQSQIKAACKDYMDTVYDQIEADLSNTTLIRDVQIDRLIPITGDWVNESTETMGTIGNSVGGLLPTVATGSITARTSVPGIRARKSISGFDEAQGVGGILSGTTTGRLAVAGAFWILGFENAAVNIVLESGVFSGRDGAFTPFNGGGLVKNIMGTMVTRKVGRLSLIHI